MTPAAEGLIPAHAGKTGHRRAASGGLWAHPRSRGENLEALEPLASGLGSSPLTRGKQRRCHARTRLRGLIPAHAGKTCRRRGRRGPSGAHPRSRGENSGVNGLAPTFLGSSPLTRGKPRIRVFRVTVIGLIPAHAGKTTPDPSTREPGRAHPRSRGENEGCACGHVRCSGSSPLTRGKHDARLAGEILEGLIPAHAGKTESQAAAWPFRRAHPRSRGENLRQHKLGLPGKGSSPLTRGKHGCGG